MVEAVPKPVFGTASLNLREKPGLLTGFSKSLFQNRAH
jgi:hypothetical protein